MPPWADGTTSSARSVGNSRAFLSRDHNGVLARRIGRPEAVRAGWRRVRPPHAIYCPLPSRRSKRRRTAGLPRRLISKETATGIGTKVDSAPPSRESASSRSPEGSKMGRSFIAFRRELACAASRLCNWDISHEEFVRCSRRKTCTRKSKSEHCLNRRANLFRTFAVVFHLKHGGNS